MELPEQITYLLTTLVAAHLVADFLLQTDRDVENKHQLRWRTLCKHGLIHAVLAYLVAGIWSLWLPVFVLAAGHIVIDLGKENLRRGFLRKSPAATGPRRELPLLALDQLLHFAAIVGIALWCAHLTGPAVEATWPGLLGGWYLRACITVAGFALAVGTGSVVIGSLTRPYAVQLNDHNGTERTSPPARGLTGAGKFIGRLERSLIFLLVITGYLSAVGFLVAAKSVFRFGELRNPGQRKEAEYILIGTLSSFAWALLVGFLTRYLLAG